MTKYQILKSKKLSFTLIGIIFLISIFFTLTQTFFILKNDYEKSIKIVNNSIEQIKSTRLKAISMSIWKLDTNQMDILADSILKLPGISYIEIIENDSNPIKLGIKKSKYIIEKTFPLVHTSLKDNKLGSIFIQGSYEKSVLEIENKIIRTILIETIKVFSISIILIFIVHHLIMRHLIAMAKYTKNLDTKKLTKPLKLNKRKNERYPDTIDIVADAINIMRENILNDLEIQVETTNKLKEEIEIRKKIEKDSLAQKNRIQEQYNTITKLTIDNKLFEKSFEEGMKFLLKECVKTLNVDKVSFWVFKNDEEIKCIHRYFKDKDLFIDENKTISVSKYPKYINYIKKHKVIDAHDVYTDQRTSEYNQEQMLEANIKSMLDVSINFHNKLYGIICFETLKEKKLWTQDEMSFASRVSDQINNLLMINEWKKVQEEIITLNDSLETTVGTRTKELKDNIKNLKITQNQLVESEKMASLGSLVAGVAHEINTPVGISLTGITHFRYITEEIKTLYDKNNLSQKEFEDYINTSYEISYSVYTSLLRAAELIKSFKQVSVDQSNEQIREFNLKSYFDEILISLHNKIKRINPTIQIYCDANLNIASYPGSISQIITNFVLNSLIHGFKDIENAIITINAKQVDNDIQIIYTDNGVGIKKENLKKVFDPFFTTNRKNGGSGLGLNIVYNIVKTRLGGNIKVESTLGEGVTFILNFPIKNI